MSRYGYIAHSELYHHGIKGQKWGIRRYQNPDGSLTEEGKRRYLNNYGGLIDKTPHKIKKEYNKYLHSDAYKLEVAEENRKYSERGSKVSKEMKYPVKNTINKIANDIEKDSDKYGKAFSWEQVQEEAIRNFKGYENLSDYDQGAIVSNIIDELEKKGYYFID